MIQGYLALEGGCVPRMIVGAYPEIGSEVALFNYGIVKVTQVSYIRMDNWVEFEAHQEIHRIRFRISQDD